MQYTSVNAHEKGIINTDTQVGSHTNYAHEKGIINTNIQVGSHTNCVLLASRPPYSVASFILSENLWNQPTQNSEILLKKKSIPDDFIDFGILWEKKR